MAKPITRIRNGVQIDGRTETINGVTVTVLVKDANKNNLICYGATVPTADSAGFSKSGLFIKTDAGDGTKGLYENQGTTLLSDFNLIGEIAAGEIPNAVVIGKLLTGFSSGAGVVAATDTILQAFNKINGNVASMSGALTPKYYVDGSRVDTYTELGTQYAPYKTIAAAIAAVNADSTIQQAAGAAAYAANARYVIDVAPGTYSDNLTIGNVKYLRINLNGAAITGNIAYDTTMVGGTADQYYSKLEFFGGYGVRAEKGNSGRITGTFTATRNNDSLTYVSFTGIDLAGNVKFTTQGTWVVHLHNSRVGAFLEGSGLNGGQVLLETTGWVEFTTAGHIANSADGSATTVAIYNGANAEFDLINITPLAESRFFNCRFKSDVTVTAQNLYLDNNSYKSLLAQTETLTGATVVLMDDYLPAASAQEEIAAAAGGAISTTKRLTFISTDAGGDAFTLADGSFIRQQKKIVFRTDGGGDAVVTGSFAGAATTLTFSDAGEYALLEWNGADWIALELGSVLDVTNAPVIA